jgi:transglutaminase-like putative cysteine protease
MFIYLKIILIISLLFTTYLSAQSPIEWEKVPIQDLQRTDFPSDSNASAIILCDFGESKLNDDLGIEYYRHIRIKILNENGYEWGTHSIYLTTSRYGERLDDLEAITYSIDANGEIVQSELDDDDIFEEEITDNRTKYTFTAPALKPGCIVDIRYKIIAESLWFIRGWTFQMSEPVLWSEYRVTYPRNIAFASVLIGYEPWALKEYNEVNQHFGGIAASYLGNNLVKCQSYRWAIEKAPALRDEPYITTLDDYASRVDIQLAAYSFPGTGKKEFLNTWQTVVDELIDHSDFGKQIDPEEVEDLTKEITKTQTSPEDKMKAIYSWINKSIVWSGSKRLFTEYDVEETLENKKGNSADITFLLLSMLKSAGLECEPVIVSTRTNGKIQDVYPIISQFDYVLARARIGGTAYFLDATDPLRSMDILPTRVLNVRGLVIKPGKPEWVHLSATKGDDDVIVLNISLNADGSIKANLDALFGQYTSLSHRNDIIGKSDIDYVKEIFKTESMGLKIDSAVVLFKDSIHLPLRIRAGFFSDNYSQLGGDLIYFNPNLIYRFTDNPFKSKVRNFPIDYAYPRSERVVINIHLPMGYELKDVYENKTQSVSNNAAFKRAVQVDGNLVQIVSKTEIKKSEIKQNFYTNLKEFYAKIIAAQSELLVIGLKQ